MEDKWLSNGDVQIELKSVDYPNGPETVGVRMKLHFSRFILNKKPDGGTRVYSKSFLIYELDPKMGC